MRDFLDTRAVYLSLFVSTVLLAQVLNGCGVMTGPEQPTIHTFLLTGEKPFEGLPTVSEEMRAGVLLVDVPRAKAGFGTSRMAYSVREHEVKYFARNQWAASPAQMLHPLLVQGLAKTQLWQTVVQMPSTIRGDFQLDTESLELGHEFMKQPSRVRLKLRMQLIEVREHRPLGTREFTVLQEALTEDPYGGVVAANRAVDELLKQVADWLTTCMTESKLRSC